MIFSHRACALEVRKFNFDLPIIDDDDDKNIHDDHDCDDVRYHVME